MSCLYVFSDRSLLFFIQRACATGSQSRILPGLHTARVLQWLIVISHMDSCKIVVYFRDSCIYFPYSLDYGNCAAVWFFLIMVQYLLIACDQDMYTRILQNRYCMQLSIYMYCNGGQPQQRPHDVVTASIRVSLMHLCKFTVRHYMS
jgi:hypothetical protein